MHQHGVRNPNGCMIFADPAGASSAQRDTVQCVHCDCHYEVEFGSGKTRGFCQNCMGPTCGAEACCSCIPFEKKLDLYEKGKISSL